MKRAGVALAGCMTLSAATAGDTAIEAVFRGCDSLGWCQFWFELPGDAGPALHRVKPDGITAPAPSEALRDRLNALLADMIHQHKRVELHRLRKLDDGALAATVTVTGVPMTEDDALQQLQRADARR